MQTRKDFIKQALLTGAALSTGISASSIPASESCSTNAFRGPGDKASGKFSIFSKNLQWLKYEEMATAAKDLGFDGIDLTVRSNGHVLPSNVEEDLPKAVAAIRKAGLDVYMMTTEIASADEPHTEAILKTASKLGIGYYRFNWFKYADNLSIQKNLEAFQKTLQKLAQLNKKYTIHGAYQNHSGAGFGAPVWDIWLVIKDLDPRWIGCQYDIRHATVEGGNSWPLGLKLLQSHIRSIYIKDFRWTKTNGAWHEENTPLGEGMVNFKKYFDLLKSGSYNGPISVHYEYPLGGAEEGAKKLNIDRAIVLTAMQKDLEKLKSWWQA